MLQKMEIETKLELDRAGFEKLMSRGINEGCVEQLNIYFDSEWKLANRASTFRIRVCRNAKPLVTFKLPVEIHKARRTAKEVEFEIGSLNGLSQNNIHLFSCKLNVMNCLPSALHSDMDILGIKDLERVGWVRNKRYQMRLAKLGVVELDHLRLPNGCDFYEVEIETEDLVTHKRLVDYVQKLIPSAKPSRLSKFERFRKVVAELHKNDGDGVTYQASF